MNPNDELIGLTFTRQELEALAKIGVGEWVRVGTIVAHAAKRSLAGGETRDCSDCRLLNACGGNTCFEPRDPAPIQDMLKTLDRRGMAAPADPDVTAMSAKELESEIIGAFAMEGYLYENALAGLVKRASGPEPNPMFVKLVRAVMYWKQASCQGCPLTANGNCDCADGCLETLIRHYGLTLDTLKEEAGIQ
jgi:hypothetical protein